MAADGVLSIDQEYWIQGWAVVRLPLLFNRTLVVLERNRRGKKEKKVTALQEKDWKREREDAYREREVNISDVLRSSACPFFSIVAF